MGKALQLFLTYAMMNIEKYQFLEFEIVAWKYKGGKKMKKAIAILLTVVISYSDSFSVSVR